MENRICCMFEGESAIQAVNDHSFEVVDLLRDKYRETRILYRCRKCGGLVLYDYEEEAHFLPGVDWDNAYIEEFYYPLLEEDITIDEGEKYFDWGAIKTRKYIAASYRELDSGDHPYRFVAGKKPKSEKKEFTKKEPAVVTVSTLPMEKSSFSDMSIFIQIPEYPVPRNLKILMPNHDDPQEIEVAFNDGSYSMELSFPMDDFGWAHPLVLGADDLSVEQVLMILTEICRKQTSTEGIPIISERFTDVTETVFPNSKEDG